MSGAGGCDMPFNQSQGCPVPVGNSVCGETNSLEIMKEFNRLYENRMQQVDSEAGGDCLQEKIKLQQEWIQNLTQQNEMLVTAVQELEYEATERVKQLEDKLHKSAQCLCEVMKKYRENDFTSNLLSKPLQKIVQLEDDTRNVLEFVRRIREKGDWSTEGLCFYNVTVRDLLGDKATIVNQNIADDISEGEKLLNEKERTVQELTQKINYFSSFGDVECMAKELQCRREECESLKEAMVDMRQVLTEEVASKHDQIILLKKELHNLEETCAQAEKQIIFKDDIIKELRKDIKQLKQQISVPEQTLNSLRAPFDQHQCPLSCINNQNSSDHPYLIIKHTSKKQLGRNTVIYVNKDGSVQKRENINEVPRVFDHNAPNHPDICTKCKNNLMTRSFFPSCKSENDLTNVKNMLRPVKERSKLSNGTLGRCKTFVDRSKLTLMTKDFKDKKCNFGYMPVKMQVHNIEKKKL